MIKHSVGIAHGLGVRKSNVLGGPGGFHLLRLERVGKNQLGGGCILDFDRVN